MGRASLLGESEILALEAAGEIFDALTLVALFRARKQR
jgi:hypothetical protein